MRKKNDKFIRCLLDVRKIPLESFRHPRDGKKWKQRARSRYHFLCKLAGDANPDGTFKKENGVINFSPGVKKLLLHMAERSLYRMTTELRELGYLSWDREKNNYGRRIFQIHFSGQKHRPDTSPERVPDTQEHMPPWQVLLAKTHATVACVITGQIDTETTDAVGVKKVKSVPDPPLESLPSTADAVAVGSFGSGDRGERVLESVHSHHRHPPSEPTAKSDDDDSRARHNSPTAKATTKPAESMELRKIKIEGFKSTALARIEAKYPNQFSRDYLYVAFAAFESRTDARISGPGFFVTCFENESDRSNEIAIETNVGAGPEIPEPSFCQQCDKTRTFHNRSIANIRRDDPKWIDHAFVNRDEFKAG